MYRVTIKTSGKYHNAFPGARYCFTKRSVINLVSNILSMESECEVEKLVRIHSDIFCWSNVETGSKIWDKISETLEKLTKEGD